MADARKTAKKAVAAKKSDSEKKVTAKPTAKKVTSAKSAAKTTEKKTTVVKPAAKNATSAKTANKDVSPALTGLMSSFLSDSSLSSVSGKAGVDSGNVAGILAAALPSLLNGANSQASSAETSESFFEAVNSHAGKNPEDVDVDEGQKIINHLLGSDAENVKNEISRKTGLSSAKVGLVLAAAAPIIMNLLGKETSSSHSSSGTASLLGSLLGGSSNSSSSNSLMTAALGSVLTGALGGNSYGNNSMLGSLLGGSTGSSSSNLLGSLLGATTGSSSNSSMASGAMGLLGSLLGGSSNNSHQQSSGSGLAGILSHLLK
ncbi:MAG: DUF937 domain-containing protein [Eubacteriales bacterium]|nr:DUF937 domain-containing protein [Eubacteriales bacterium]